MDRTKLIVVRGAGDIATGTICRLHRCGFKLLLLETKNPTAIRRAVSLAGAVYDGTHTVEGVTAERIENIAECNDIWRKGWVPVLVDPEAGCLKNNTIKPLAVVDAILAKKNCGTTINMGDITIGLGPGFCAGLDVDVVIETNRGHDLGRVIVNGTASANTGVPGAINGFTTERVIYAPCRGLLSVKKHIGSIVQQGELLAEIDKTRILAPIGGLLRGMLCDRSLVYKRLKIADIDPRYSERNPCFTTISDKARCISGGVLEALFLLLNSEANDRHKGH
ncbi:MAG: selenium-dependent molybdenum cofactor biosynthesis protein YqeB [Desulforhopalus sp.]